ncbi:acireductone synthase [Hyalangium rubrum]|uniref:Enolase-phosphatase E1 n=1 Tax=Hyalangium rubrum TaxID=3103134 RepID=A0ABU5H335_9BACT|nr:acireductone synthase [Hyalangium sp. s54d21]MDY7227726.1 acireductone synthase [Hyalangium sp. s54d21]
MIRAIVTDIEGTTSSLRFVHEVLFPYSARHLEEFVLQHLREPAVREQLHETARLAELDPEDTPALIAQLLRWIAEDRKSPPLKLLQGMLWERGYREGAFQGHLYEDAAQLLRQWQRQGLRLYVYSSGSEQAQKLLFGYSSHGDLTPLFSVYFDTRVGAKREVASYRRIAQELGEAPGNILFLSDVKEELDAARAAGLHTTWLVREGALPAQPLHPVARDFHEVRLDA